MEETGKFPEGIIVDKAAFRDFTLTEQTFRHTLEVAHDPAIDKVALDDGVYYSACLLAKRLHVVGLDQVTPEQVLDLSPQDGEELIHVSVVLANRRKAFRGAAEAATKNVGSAS